MSTVALDIETVSPDLDDVTEVDFLDSREFEVVAIGVGHRLTPTSEIDVDVLWRSGIEQGDEYELICELVYWLTERHADTLLTYNGFSFDMRHLRGRAQILANELGDKSLPEAVHVSLQSANHRDLMHDIVAEHGHRLTLEDAVEEYCETRPATVQWDGETVTNGRVPDLAEDLLAYRTGLSDMSYERAMQLKDVLNTYIREDIRPLFDLADALKKEK